jgi:hypothetical protein
MGTPTSKSPRPPNLTPSPKKTKKTRRLHRKTQPSNKTKRHILLRPHGPHPTLRRQTQKKNRRTILSTQRSNNPPAYTPNQNETIQQIKTIQTNRKTSPRHIQTTTKQNSHMLLHSPLRYNPH